MEVNIPLIQNQVIDHTGTYHIVQRTINGQTGLVIEEYIPEPEPQNNTRAMIIDEDENNNENNEENNNDDGQMVLRGQNNVRGLPDSNGTAIEGTFEINITPTTTYYLYMDYFYVSYLRNALPTASNTEICVRERWTALPLSQSTIILPSNCTIIQVFNNEPRLNGMIAIYIRSNTSSSSITTATPYAGGYYYITQPNSNLPYLHIRSTNDNTDIGEMILFDNNYNDTLYNNLFLNSNSYAVDFSS